MQVVLLSAVATAAALLKNYLFSSATIDTLKV